MVRIPSSTTRQEAAPDATPPAVPSDDGASEPTAGEIVELEAEGGETVSVVVPAGVMAQAREPAAAEGPDDALAETPKADGTAPSTEPAPAVVASLEAMAEQAPSVAAPADDRTAFKVVLTIKPAAEGRWHAIIAVGRDGCDPVFEPAGVADWPDALDAVLGVQAAAEARWAERPRNPMAQVAVGGNQPAATTPAANDTARPASGRRAAAAAPGTESPASPQDTDARRSASPTETGGSKAKGRASAPATATPTPPKGVPSKVAAPAATVLSGGVEKLTLF